MAGVPLERLCIHQVTLMQCGFADGLECLARHGVPMTAIWHEKLEETGVAAARRVLADTQVEAVALCVGGTMAIGDAAARASQIELTRRRIEFCAELGIESLLMLTGGLGSGETDLLAARLNALEGFDSVVPEARAAGVRLVLEPLHPMVCGFRSVISTLSAACDFLDELDADDATGVALDTYALWWDLNLPRDIRRAAPRLRHFHVSDWLAETTPISALTVACRETASSTTGPFGGRSRTPGFGARSRSRFSRSGTGGGNLPTRWSPRSCSGHRNASDLMEVICN